MLAEIACASLVCILNTEICGLYDTYVIENGVLCNGQQLRCAGRVSREYSLSYEHAKCS